MKILSAKDLIKIGFKEMPHFTVMGNLTYDLGRNRHLSIGDVGTPNEMVFINVVDNNDYRNVTESVCIHNYDYDGNMTIDKMKLLIYSIGKTI